MRLENDNSESTCLDIRPTIRRDIYIFSLAFQVLTRKLNVNSLTHTCIYKYKYQFTSFLTFDLKPFSLIHLFKINQVNQVICHSR